MADNTLYKALKSDGTSPYQNHPWPLPSKNGDGWDPGDWVEAGPGDLVECHHGIHACTIHQLPRWLHEDLYILEPAEGTDRIDGDDKTVVRRARLVRPVETWTETTARLFAADCAEMVLPIWEGQHPDDDRPRRAIEASRAYARGEIGEEELRAAWSAERAAMSAARSAARSAAWSAAKSAMRAAMRAAMSAARSAARSAAWSAVRGAAQDVMGDRLALYLERGEAASEEPVPDIRSLLDDEEAGA